MKKYLFGAIAVGMALSLSAFTSSKRAVTYYQKTAGTYFRDKGSAIACGAASTNPCTYTFSTDPNVASFPANNVPPTGAPSATNNIYQ